MTSATPKHGITGNFSITKDEVQLFLDLTKRVKPSKGQVFRASKKVTDKQYRDVDIYYIESEEEDLYAVLQKVAQTANRYFKYDINGIEKAQVMKYTAPSNGYGWHIDIGAEGIAANRKIGVSILLNEDYKGGQFQFKSWGHGSKPKITTVPISSRGSIVVFPSFLYHRVKPVTKGIRYSLVAWFLGPHFK